ncbi:MAG: hypothetical protein A2W00_02775 [Candidatus Eisenbacteria bacterium RBG_16_71_46]|nr:MAG: hypothetical protein A2W00_02775 [Candidatus Eisenbacteria bacterium RBG_16_71_46]
MRLRWLRIGACAAALASCAGCTPKLGGAPLPNQRPVVTLSHAPANASDPYHYAYRLQWFGYDPDGTVDHYLYAVDPPSAAEAETLWTITRASSQTFQFSATSPYPDSPDSAFTAHTFVIEAVDERGLASLPVFRSFLATTVAPTVQIQSPPPNRLVPVQLAPSVTIRWSGEDPDGSGDKKPRRYKFILLGPGTELLPDQVAQDPDLLRRRYAPDFVGWTPADSVTTSAQFTNLTPSATYLFAVVAFDEAGAYTAIMTLDSNLLRFRVGVAGTLGPRLTVYNDFFRYEYVSGGYSLDPQAEIPVEVIAGFPVTINWFATPTTGTTLVGYRWRVGGDVDDETSRTDEETDIGHWSQLSLFTTRATLGPFSGGLPQKLFIEVRDDLGFRSLGVVRFEVVAAGFARELLIVDDTRFTPDQVVGGACIKAPTGVWPMASELDTFLYARGGVQWKCLAQSIKSTPGIFAGYDFDTIGTPHGTLPFAKLAEYRHVIWLVDAKSALNSGPNDITSLRSMSRPLQVNSLESYLKLGGKVWLVGGGGGYAATVAYDDRSNNSPGPVFSADRGELAPGVLMYDFAHWRSEFTVATGLLTVSRAADPTGGPPGTPDYGVLPPSMRLKSAATDPLPANRTGQNPSVFYLKTFEVEFLRKPNPTFEDLDPDPAIDDEVSMLDSLYKVTGFSVPGPAVNPQNVCMTYYRGSESPPFVFTGFNIWTFSRDDCAALADFVLQRLWGLPRRTPAAATVRVAPP